MNNRTYLTPAQRLALADVVLKEIERLFPAAQYSGQEEALALAMTALCGADLAQSLLGAGR